MADHVLTIHLPEGQEERRLIGNLYKTVASLLLDDRSSVASAGEDDDEPAATTGRTFRGEQGEVNLRLLLREIQPNARRFLRAVADETLATGQPVSSTRLREITGATSPPQVSGWIASIGFAERRLDFAERPYSQQWTYTGVETNGGWENTYTIESQIAELIRQLVVPDGGLAEA
jgi:hypothetical protein